MAAKKKSKPSGPYFIHYVENSSPKIKGFKSESSANRFVEDFSHKPEDGYWIDFIVKGEFLWLDENYYEERK